MAQVHLGQERDTPTGWAYDATVTTHAGTTHHTITLSWHDHDHWTGGATRPSTLIAGLVALLLDEGIQLPPRFDASTARRWVHNLDERLA